MHSYIAFLNLAVAVFGYSLDLALTYLVFRQRLFGKLISFSLYFSILIPWDFFWLWLSHTPRFLDPFWGHFYWTSQLVFTILRLFTISEISWRALHEYPAVWSITWRLLGIVSVLLLLWIGNSAWHNANVAQTLISNGFLRFEFMQAVLLLAVLGIGAYYQILVPPLFRWVLAGIGVYAAVQVADFQLGLITKYPPGSLYDFVKHISFLAALIIWTWGIWRWANVPFRPTVLVSQQTYDDLSPQVHDRLRDLNDRLADLLNRRK